MNEERKLPNFVLPQPPVDMFKTPTPEVYKNFEPVDEYDEYDEDDWEEATFNESLMESLMESFKGILGGSLEIMKTQEADNKIKQEH